MSKILGILVPVHCENKITISKSKNFVLLYKHSDIEFQLFVNEFKDICSVLDKKLIDFRIQRIEGKHFLVLLKIKIHQKNELKLKSDFFDMPIFGLKPQIYNVEVVDTETLEKLMNKMDGGLQAVKKQDFGYEIKKRQKRLSNKEFFDEFQKKKSLQSMVKSGSIHLKDVSHYKECLDILEKEEQKLKKKVKGEEN